MARRQAEEVLRNSEGVPVSQPLGSIQSIGFDQTIKFPESTKGVYSIQYNFDGSILATGLGSGGIQLFDGFTGAWGKELRKCRHGGDAVMVLRFHPTNSKLLYAGTADGKIYVYDCQEGDLIETMDEPGNEINALDFSRDGQNFVTGGKDVCVRVYDQENRQCGFYQGASDKPSDSSEQTNVGLTARIFCIKFHCLNQFVFLTGGWDNHITVWDHRDSKGGIKRNIFGPHICGDALDMIGDNILSGQWSGLHSLQQYSYCEGKLKQEFKFPAGKDGAFLYCAQYLDSRYAIAGGSGTNSAEVIDLEQNKHVGGYKLDCPVQAIDSTNCGRQIAIGGPDSKLVLLKALNDDSGNQAAQK